MSYYADHLAWQQRVNIETKQQHNGGTDSVGQLNQTANHFAYPELMDL